MILVSEAATTSGTISVYSTRSVVPTPPSAPARKATRCIGRVGRRRCKCMANDLWCHRHKAQETAYFLRLNKPWSPSEVLEDLAEKAIQNWDLEDAEFDAGAGTLTVKDWAGATFTLTMTNHVKARPFRERLAAALARDETPYPPPTPRITPMSERDWQPIETAPKDGTPILGTDGDDITTVRWSLLGRYWQLCVVGRGAEDGEWWPCDWQPLPPSPIKEE